MEAVRRGGDRQALHEVIRQHSHAASAALKGGSPDNDLIHRLQRESAFADIDIQSMLDPSRFVGRAPEQVDEFLEREVVPIRQRFASLLNQSAKLAV